MGWFSSKTKEERNNAAYAKGVETREKASPVEKLSYSISMSLPSSSSEDASFKAGYKEAERREYAGNHSKKK